MPTKFQSILVLLAFIATLSVERVEGEREGGYLTQKVPCLHTLVHVTSPIILIGAYDIKPHGSVFLMKAAVSLQYLLLFS